jgi:hypothetical protein
VWHDGKAALRISYPARWHLTTRRLTMITQPAERFVVYSGSPPGSLDEVAPRADQALVLVMEQTSVSSADLRQFPRRPKRFTVWRLSGMETFEGERWAERVFQDHGRAFYAFIWVGAHDSRQLPTLLTILDSLRVT